MGLNAGTLPDHFLEKLFPQERKRLASEGIATNAEARAKYERQAEKAMHDHFANWLMLRGIPFYHAQMNKPSTIKVGAPDFIILFNNLNLSVEFKASGKKLRPEQQKEFEFLRRAGNRAILCHSFTEAIQETKTHFSL